MKFRFDLSLPAARRTFFILIAFNLTIVALYLLNMAMPAPNPFVRDFLNLDGERSLPTWFSSAQLLLIGGVLLFIAQRKKNALTPVRTGFPLSNRFLSVVGWVFVFLSMDEVAMFHERLNFMLAPVSWLPRFSGDHGIWMLIYVAAGLILLVYLRQDVWRLVVHMPRPALFLAVGFGTFMVGGIAFDIIANIFLRSMDTSLIYYTEVAAEEFLEMAGGSLMLYGAVLAGSRLEQEIEAPSLQSLPVKDRSQVA
jgi:hypothetical protein